MSGPTDGSLLKGEDRENYVRGLFDRIATPYDRLNRLISFGRDAAWRRSALRLADLKPSDRVADLGTGTGDLFMEIAKERQSVEDLVGIDLSPEMLAVAKEKAKSRYANASIDLRVGNALDTGLESENFDLVCMSWVLRNVASREEAYAEVLRILKPGGRFLCLDMSTPSFAPLRWASAIHLRGCMPGIVRIVGADLDAYRYLTQSTARFPRKHALSDEMRKAGFRDIQTRAFGLGCIAAHVARKENRS